MKNNIAFHSNLFAVYALLALYVLVWESADDSFLLERMSILNAYFLPGVGPGVIYPAISPVNSFRVIFDQYFGTEFGFLEDMNFFSTASRPYAFIEVTDQVQK